MTEPMVTDEDREIARRWLSEGQINVDQMGRAAVLVAIRQEYLAALAAEREECARVADKYREMSCESADKALEKGDIDEHQEHAGDASIAKYIAAAIRGLE